VLDHRHVAAKAAGRLCRFEADVAAAEQNEMGGQPQNSLPLAYEHISTICYSMDLTCSIRLKNPSVKVGCI